MNGKKAPINECYFIENLTFLKRSVYTTLYNFETIIMKLRIRLFIALCFVLLIGSVGLSARTAHQQFLGYETSGNSEEFQNAGVYSALSDISNYTSCHVEKLNDKTYPTDNETEENELTSSKKWLELNNYFTTVLYTQVPARDYYTIKKRLQLCKPFLFLPSCKKFIIFRVIRI